MGIPSGDARLRVGVFEDSFSELVDAGYLLEFPECLSGGEYIYSASDATVECSVHGHFE